MSLYSVPINQHGSMRKLGLPEDPTGMAKGGAVVGGRSPPGFSDSTLLPNVVTERGWVARQLPSLPRPSRERAWRLPPGALEIAAVTCSLDLSFFSSMRWQSQFQARCEECMPVDYSPWCWHEDLGARHTFLPCWAKQEPTVLGPHQPPLR